MKIITNIIICLCIALATSVTNVHTCFAEDDTTTSSTDESIVEQVPPAEPNDTDSIYEEQ